MKTAYQDGLDANRSDEREGRTRGNATKQHFRRAVEKGKKVLADHGDSKYVADAYILVGKSYYYLENYGLSRNFLTELISNYSSSKYYEEARLYLGKSYFKLRELPLARHEFDYLINNSENPAITSQAYLALADLNRAEGKVTAMLESVDKAIDIAVDNEIKADAAWSTAQWAINQARYEQAERFLAQAAHFTHKPQFDNRLQLELARIHRRQGKYETATTELKTMLADEDFQAIWPLLEVERGLLYEAQGDTAHATELYRFVLKEYESSEAVPAADYQLGMLSYARRDYTSASSLFQQVLKHPHAGDYKGKADKKFQLIKSYQTLRDARGNLESQFVSRYEQTHFDTTSIGDSLQNQTESDRIHKEAARDSVLQIRMGNPVKKERRVQGRKNPESGQPAALLQDEGSNEIIQPKINPTTVENKSVAFKEIYEWLKAQDSLPKRQQYLNTLYQIAEMSIFELEQPEYGIALTDTVLELAKRDEIKTQTQLLRLYTYSTVLNDPREGSKLRELLDARYSHTQAYKSAFREGEMTPDTAAVFDAGLHPGQDMYLRADSLFGTENYEHALSIFRKINQKFPSTYYGAKSLYAVGWLYEHKISELDSAIAVYNRFREHYPENQLLQHVETNIQELNKIQTALTEEKSQSAQTDSLMNPSTPTQDE